MTAFLWDLDHLLLFIWIGHGDSCDSRIYADKLYYTHPFCDFKYWIDDFSTSFISNRVDFGYSRHER